MRKIVIILILLCMCLFNSTSLVRSSTPTVSVIDFISIPDNITPKIKIFYGYKLTCQEVGLLVTNNAVVQFECFMRDNPDILIYKKETSYNKHGNIKSITIYYK